MKARDLFCRRRKVRELRDRAVGAVLRFKACWRMRVRRLGGELDYVHLNYIRYAFSIYATIKLSPFEQGLPVETNFQQSFIT